MEYFCAVVIAQRRLSKKITFLICITITRRLLHDQRCCSEQTSCPFLSHSCCAAAKVQALFLKKLRILTAKLEYAKFSKELTLLNVV